MNRSHLPAPSSRHTGLLLGTVALLTLAVLGHCELRALEAAADAHGVTAVDAAAADTDPALVSHGEGVVLGQPTPNPFTATMGYSYSISGEPAWVDISVFDGDGRRVRILAHGTQAAGDHEATWDGLGDDGAPVQYGMYFLRARVGEERHVSRVLYLQE